jgi:hypothetical protein
LPIDGYAVDFIQLGARRRSAIAGIAGDPVACNGRDDAVGRGFPNARCPGIKDVPTGEGLPQSQEVLPRYRGCRGIDCDGRPQVRASALATRCNSPLLFHFRIGGTTTF